MTRLLAGFLTGLAIVGVAFEVTFGWHVLVAILAVAVLVLTIQEDA